MAIETGAEFIQDLVEANPPGTDKKHEGDDHLRLIKEVLKNTFPNASRGFPFPTTAGVSSSMTITALDENKTFLITPSVGMVVTLPALGSENAGLVCHFIKTAVNATPYFFDAAGSVTFITGYLEVARARRAVPGVRTTALWTGVNWILTRSVNGPIGSIIDYAGFDLPHGFVLASGANLSSTADFPEYNQVRGGLSTPDLRGRIVAGRDNMGGSSAGRLAAVFDATALWNAAGLSQTDLEASQLPGHTHAGGSSGEDTPDHTHLFEGGNVPTSVQTGPGVTVLGWTGAQTPRRWTGGAVVSGTTTESRHTHSGSGGSAGGGQPHDNVQPTFVLQKLVVVE